MPAIRPQKDFNRKKARETEIPGMPVAVFEQGGWLWWRLPPPEDTPVRVVSAEDALYGRLPRLGAMLTPETWGAADTGAGAGTLKGAARAAFQDIAPARETFIAHAANGGPWHAAPASVKGVLPAIFAILATDRANLPEELRETLWPLMNTSVRTGSALIPPGGGGRLVERRGAEKKAPPDIWHDHLDGHTEPKWDAGEIRMPRHDYVLSNAITTALSDDHRFLKTKRDIDRAVADGYTIVGSKIKHGILNPYNLEPFEVGLFTNASWHSSRTNTADVPVERHFMRVFTGIEASALRRIAREDPETAALLRRHLRREGPDRLYVSRELA